MLTQTAYCDSGLCHLRAEGPEGEPVAPNPPLWRPRPGYALKSLLARFGIRAGGCGCESASAEMDRGGIAWTLRRLPELSTQMARQASARGYRNPLLHRPVAVLLILCATLASPLQAILPRRRF